MTGWQGNQVVGYRMPDEDRSNVSCIRYMPSTIGLEYLRLSALYIECSRGVYGGITELQRVTVNPSRH